MDLNDLKPNTAPIVVELKNPSNNEPVLNADDSPMTIEVHPEHSDAYKKYLANRIDAAYKKGDDTSEFSYERIMQEEVELLANLTASWSITLGGKKPKMTVGKAKEVYSEFYWVKEQVDKALKSADLFTKP